MIILSTSASSLPLRFIPREYNADKVVITDEDTNKSVEYTGLTFTEVAYYLDTNITFNPVLKEGTFYVLNVEYQGKSVYRDRIFCTDQAPSSSYTINKDEYKEHETTNEYIVL
tara:strand:+ start:4187 stop:4525 length:339 start_codon:yes stop_codon:yes gene_type:complete